MTKKLTLLFALLLQAAFVLEAKQMSTQEGVDIISVKSASQHADQDRSNVISAEILSHTLTISFNEGTEIAHLMVSDSNGAVVEYDNMITGPNTKCIYISECGYYRIDIVLNNGDIYYGYFTVREGILI
ncbi:MAG: DUF3244 domain-containing protein [Bacteroidales bacterium]|nr:DUF3244 domain-containing protein [Bacteroidales bacterium]